MSELKGPLRTSMRPVSGDVADLRDLARRELVGDRTGEPGQLALRAGMVSRATLEVTIDERTELVTLTSEGGRLRVSATDTATSALSPAGRLALAWLASLEREAPSTSLRPAAPKASDKLAERLAELAVAITRSGVEAADPASVRDALPRVVAELPSPLPLPVARWLGRLVNALAESDARQVARLLVGTVGPSALGLPFYASEEPVSDRRFVELARESVDAHGGTTIERRVLLDDERGELVVEERACTDAGPTLDASVGPCPRVLDVGLGVMRAGIPAQLRAQQYTVSSVVSPALYERIEALALPVAAAQVAALAAIRAQPASAEPLSLVASPSVEDGELVDGEGNKIPLAKEDPGAAEALLESAQRERLGWVLVRWATRENGLAAVPLAAAHRQGGSWRHVRLR